MPDTRDRKRRRLTLKGAERAVVTQWIEYKLEQVQRSIDYYESIPKAERTEGDHMALATYQIWAGALKWSFPGGRGRPNG